MVKNSLCFVAILISSITLISCQNNVGATTKTERTINVDDNNNRSGLDILEDYDKDIWVGPEGWSEQQWAWKTLLRWDRECDYIAEVEEYTLSVQYKLITVQCIPGAYQPMYYLFLFDNETEKSTQLTLGHPENTDNPKEVFGTIHIDTSQKKLSILTLSRGLGDCGIYRKFDFIDHPNLEDSFFKLGEFRQQTCKNNAHDKVENLPKELFDYENWPQIKE